MSEKLQMAHLTTSPLLIALLETGTSLPIMLLGFSAGVIADIMDRRKLLIATHTFMLVCAAALSGLTFFGLTTPKIILTVSFLIGTASALSMPAYQAIVPELVENNSLVPEGTILNSAGYNMSRVLGPAAGGFIFDIFGAHWAFLINALSFLGVIVALAIWKRCPPVITHAHEPFWAAMRSGFNYVRHSSSYRITILWAMGYGWFGSVIFSLLPSLIIHNMKLSSRVSGSLMSCIGIGAVTVIFLLPPLRCRFKTNKILVGFGLFAVASQALISQTHNVFIMAVCLVISGMSWLAIMSTVTISIQLSVPTCMKARAFGIYYMVWGATMALGAAFWGKLAVGLGVRTTIGCAAIGMLLVLILLNRMKITTFDSELAA
jgi:predicted MFS family arabinose efflux permease